MKYRSSNGNIIIDSDGYVFHSDRIIMTDFYSPGIDNTETYIFVSSGTSIKRYSISDLYNGIVSPTLISMPLYSIEVLYVKGNKILYVTPSYELYIYNTSTLANTKLSSYRHFMIGVLSERYIITCYYETTYKISYIDIDNETVTDFGFGWVNETFMESSQSILIATSSGFDVEFKHVYINAGIPEIKDLESFNNIMPIGFGMMGILVSVPYDGTILEYSLNNPASSVEEQNIPMLRT